MIIAQISDTHIALDTPDSEQRILDFEQTIADINALDPAPDVIVHTGDLVHNGRPDEYASAMATLAKAHAPVYVLPGNKDDRENMRAAISASGYLAPRSAFIQYAIEDFPVRLIGLDTLNPNSNKGSFCAARTQHLIDMIDADPGKPVAVFAHHPPFEVSVGPDPLHFDPLESMKRLRDALQHSGQVIAVFSGHVHRFASGTIGDIPASVVTAVATTLRKGEYPPEQQSGPLYHLHRFAAGAKFVTETRVANAGRTVTRPQVEITAEGGQ